MNWDQIERDWTQFKGSVKQRWGKLTEDQIRAIAGRRTLLVARIRDAYAVSIDDADKQLAAWQESPRRQSRRQ